MQPLEMQRLLRKRPFEPFRVYLSDGRVFDIRHPHLTLVTELRFIIGVPDPAIPEPTIAERAVRVDWLDILKVEHLQPVSPG
jgi:hypothetical protein